jgi:hypothetical protein
MAEITKSVKVGRRIAPQRTTVKQTKAEKKRPKPEGFGWFENAASF